jgi:hypothetical protein
MVAYIAAAWSYIKTVLQWHMIFGVGANLTAIGGVMAVMSRNRRGAYSEV